jgi:hypothetical protein
LKWADKHCQGQHGWHFDANKNAVVSFAQQNDAVLWSLKWAEYYNTDANNE